MPGCRKLLTPSYPSAERGRVDASSYIRHRGRAPRACNDNRRASTPGFWRWAAVLGVAPMIALVTVVSILL